MSLAQHLHLSPTTPAFFQRLPQRNWVPSGCWFQVPVPRVAETDPMIKKTCTSESHGYKLFQLVNKKDISYNNKIQQISNKQVTRTTTSLEKKKEKHKKTGNRQHPQHLQLRFSLSWGYHEGWEPLFNHGLAPLLAIYFYGSAAAQGAGDGMRNAFRRGGSAMGRSEYYSHLRTVFI